jgi:hypothetical protein
MARRATEEDQERRAEVMRQRRRGQTFEAIGEQLGITKQRAHQLYWDTLKDIPRQETDLHRAEQAERLDEMLRKAYEVLEKRHITVSNGKVIYLDDGPMEDDAPTLMAIKTILQIEERRAKLLGLDTPVKQQVEVDGSLRYEIVGVDLDQLK